MICVCGRSAVYCLPQMTGTQENGSVPPLLTVSKQSPPTPAKKEAAKYDLIKHPGRGGREGEGGTRQSASELGKTCNKMLLKDRQNTVQALVCSTDRNTPTYCTVYTKILHVQFLKTGNRCTTESTHCKRQNENMLNQRIDSR
jgi:hypothetical protein